MLAIGVCAGSRREEATEMVYHGLCKACLCAGHELRWMLAGCAWDDVRRSESHRLREEVWCVEKALRAWRAAL